MEEKTFPLSVIEPKIIILTADCSLTFRHCSPETAGNGRYGPYRSRHCLYVSINMLHYGLEMDYGMGGVVRHRRALAVCP